MSELAPAVWEEIARQYRAGIPIAVIAEAFHVSRSRIRRRVDVLGWVRDQVQNGGATSNAKPAGSQPASGNAAVASAAGRRRLLIERQRADWDDISAIREDAYRVLRGEEPRIIKGIATNDGMERVSIAATLLAMVDKDATSLMRAQEGQRRAFGFDYRQEAETKENVEAREQRIEKVRRLHEIMEDLARAGALQAYRQSQQDSS